MRLQLSAVDHAQLPLQVEAINLIGAEVRLELRPCGWQCEPSGRSALLTLSTTAGNRVAATAALLCRMSDTSFIADQAQRRPCIGGDAGLAHAWGLNDGSLL
ncbi:hypothetical protein ULF88_08025 [Halopseudomonas pachastrellae]|nr:hypothetical protein [Halopseudomonas pachastrellae]